MYSLIFAWVALQHPADVAVMVHGAGGGGWEYHLWQPVFEKAGWVVVAPDLMPADGGLEKTRFADYLSQVQDWSKRRGGKLVLIGASMGGILSLKAAETVTPDAIILVNSTTPAGVGPRRGGAAAPAIIRWANGPREETEVAMPDSDQATIDYAWKRWRDESGAVVNEIRSGIQARKPACPVLVVLGQKDTDIPHTTGLELARWAGADVHLYAGMSHVGPLMSTRAAEVAHGVLDWVKKRSRAASSASTSRE
jgi:alpha-beta hydrolase superfamily lysophospholipase